MPPFAVFQKSWFREVSGTLRRGPWGPGEVETEFFFKIFDGHDQTLPMTPHMPPFASLNKVGFRMSREPFVGVPGDPVRSKRIFFQNF